MKIALSLLSGVSYGGSTYCKYLIPFLAKKDKVNEYHIFVGKAHPLVQSVRQENFVFHEISWDVQKPWVRHFWEQLLFPLMVKKMGIDVIFTAKNANILLAPCPTIISIQNMEPLCYRQYKNDWRLNFFSYLRGCLTRLSIRKAHYIIAVSNFVKDYLMFHFPQARQKIYVVYNGNPILPDVAAGQSNDSHGSFILSSSKFVAYANQMNLILGYAELHKKDKDIPNLWLAGGILDKKYFHKVSGCIEENGLSEKVKILGFIPHERLLHLYRESAAFIFPSTLEACPQTLIEAMACGAAIAASDLSPMPETCGEAAIYFDPFDKHDIANKIQILLKDIQLTEYLKAEALKRCQFFAWDKVAKEIVAVFEKVST